MRTILGLFLLAAFALASAMDTNVTGKWSGSFNIINADGQTKESTAVLLLKQSGSEITGTVGPNEDEQHTISKGTIEGEKIALLVEEDGRTMKFNLVLADDRITGDVNIAHEGQTGKAKIDVTRAK